MDKIAAVGLGANMDSPVEMIRKAVRRLADWPGLRLLAESSIYLTRPQGGPQDQAWFHNSVVLLESALRPLMLLATLMDVEASLGRTRDIHWGPRVIDLDLLFFGQEVVDDPPDLILPHPRIQERRFALAPLAEVAPDWRHPLLGRTVTELLRDLPQEGQEIRKAADI